MHVISIIMALHVHISNVQLSLCKNSYISIGIMKHHLLYINLFLFVCVDLNAVVQFITGTQSTAGSKMVSFSRDVDAISANTCGRPLTLSTHIPDQTLFNTALKMVISENSFTMV